MEPFSKDLIPQFGQLQITEEAKVNELSWIIEETDYQGDPQTLEKYKENILKLQLSIKEIKDRKDNRIGFGEKDFEFIEKASKEVLKTIEIEEQSELIDQAIHLHGKLTAIEDLNRIPFLIYFLSQHSGEERKQLIANLTTFFSTDSSLGDEPMLFFKHNLQDRLLFTALPQKLIFDFFNTIDDKLNTRFKTHRSIPPYNSSPTYAEAFFHLLPPEFKTQEKIKEIIDSESPLDYLATSKLTKEETSLPPSLLLEKQPWLFSLHDQATKLSNKIQG